MSKPDKKQRLKPNEPANKLQRIIIHYGWAADNAVARIRAVWPRFMHAAWVSGAGFTILAATVLGASFLKSESVEYSFAKASNCITNPVFLPSLATYQADNYRLEYANVRSVFGYPVFSARTCLHINEPFLPKNNQEVRMSHSLLPIGRKNIVVDSPHPPTVKLGRPSGLPIATSGSLVLHLSGRDSVFTYRLTANERDVNCAKLDMALLCNLDRLKLEQDGKYSFRVARYFDGRPGGQVFQQELKTVEPVKIIKSSISPGQKVQNEPEQIVLTANKDLETAGNVTLERISSDKRTLLGVNFETDGKRLIARFDKPLPRSASFELTISDLTAKDDAYQLKPFTFKFSTSGGPKVAGVNIGTYGVGMGQTIVLTLDTEPKAGQNLGDFISLNSGFEHSISASGRQIIISPSGSWPRCSKFTVQVKDGLKNKFDISGGSAWKLNSRTICQTISSIGNSLEGRGIYAHRFGNGSQVVMFVGGIHGNEPSSTYTLNSWIDRLEASYDSIPSNKTIVVIPSVNPDGIAAGTRTNSRHIDLNRNFPANDWKKDVVMPGGNLNKGGGGDFPLSEPEAAALASFTLSQNPKLVMSYHAVGSLVLGNGAGQSDGLASSYASSVGYWVPSGNGVFDYDTTGAYEDWLRDKHGIPAVLVELSSYYGNEFWNHQSAMWNAASF